MKKILLFIIPVIALISAKIGWDSYYSATAATTFYISSSTGSDNNPGTDSAHPWKSVRSYAAGNTYLFNRGDTFYLKLPKLSTTTASSRLTINAYGTGANPVISAYSTIKSAAWQPAGTTNVWKATLITGNVTGLVPSESNCGLIKVDGTLHGFRRGNIKYLANQWDFYCDFSTGLYVYSVGNPNTQGTLIQVSNSDEPIKVSDHMTIKNVKIMGCSEQAFLMTQPSDVLIDSVQAREIGGAMKNSTDSTRQGAGIATYNGGTNLTISHCDVRHTFECAYTFQTHASGPVAKPYTNCLIDHCTSDSCESSFNPSIAVTGAPGFINCRVQYCNFRKGGYSWSHFAKANDNQAVGILNNFSDGDPSQNDIIVQFDTIYLPREGAYFVSGSDPVLPFKSMNNYITLDTGVYIRKNATAIKWPFKIADHQRFVDTSGADVGTIWVPNGSTAVPTTRRYYRDADGDNYGAVGTHKDTTGIPSGYILDSTDCNDLSAAVNPGHAEICGNGIDDNCNGFIDEGCTIPGMTANDVTVYEADGVARVLFSLSGVSNTAVTFNCSTSDGTAGFPKDYKKLSSQVVTIPAGSLSVSVPITISQDRIVEPSEYFYLTISSLKGTTTTTNQVKITILDSN